MAQGGRVAEPGNILDMLFPLGLTLSGEGFHIEPIRGIHDILLSLPGFHCDPDQAPADEQLAESGPALTNPGAQGPGSACIHLLRIPKRISLRFSGIGGGDCQ